MRAIVPMEIGLMFWAVQDSAVSLRQLEAFGLTSGQLGVPPELDCDKALESWSAPIGGSKLCFTSAVCSYQDEDYANLARIHETVGFTTPRYRADRIARTRAVSTFAHTLGIPAVSCHIGFIPADATLSLYKELADLTAELCDFCAANEQDFVLETGQESAEVLLSFIADVGRPNLKVNFDPANMVMYQSGDPVAALGTLSDHVLSVHCKDADISPDGSGKLGHECVLGEGAVNFPAFLQKLKDIGYQGLLTIEREEPDQARRTADIHTGVARLNQWKAGLGL